MTEQFKPGETYATRGGDRVRVTDVDQAKLFPIEGDWETGEFAGDGGAWRLSGAVESEGLHHPEDLLPTPLPDAQDDKAELVAACKSALAWMTHWRDDVAAGLKPTRESIANAAAELTDAIRKAERTS